MGSNVDYDVMLSVTNGQLTGLITGNQKRYGIEKTITDTYNMIDIRLEGYPDQDISDSEPFMDTVVQNTHQGNTSVSRVKQFDVFNEDYLNTTTSFTSLDLMIFWTEQSRIDAGGDPSDPDDTQDIEALMLASVDHTNVELINSQTNTRVYKVYTARLHGFVLTGNIRNDRNTFRTNLSVIISRNIVGADIATLMVENYSSDFNACGVAYVQTYPQCDSVPQAGCDVGADFANFAFSIVSQQCAIFDDTFTHEIGHLLGGNHVQSQLLNSWSNSIINNGYPEAFGKIVPNVFASIMSIDFDTPRRLYFSNPDVTVNGVSSGDSATKNNASIIDNLSPAMEDFRISRDLIFQNGFDQ